MLSTFLAGNAQIKNEPGTISSKELAKKYSIICNKPAPDFFEGALLGNGGMGVVVTTRPDAIVLYFDITIFGTSGLQRIIEKS
ncbi:MAG: hypothetical protein JWQ09_3939 [Segetibacter sp.]|nr:hypothetical protein [Segetibacter sp.]